MLERKNLEKMCSLFIYSPVFQLGNRSYIEGLIHLERDHHSVPWAIGELHGHGLVALAYVKIYSMGFLARCTKFAPTKISPSTVASYFFAIM